jgi:hypothetical protein
MYLPSRPEMRNFKTYAPGYDKSNRPLTTFATCQRPITSILDLQSTSALSTLKIGVVHLGWHVPESSMGVRITTKTTRPSQSLRACHPKIKLGQSTSALSTFDFGVAKLVKSFGLSENHRKSLRLSLRVFNLDSALRFFPNREKVSTDVSDRGRSTTTHSLASVATGSIAEPRLSPFAVPVSASATAYQRYGTISWTPNLHRNRIAANSVDLSQHSFRACKNYDIAYTLSFPIEAYRFGRIERQMEVRVQMRHWGQTTRNAMFP